MPQSPLWEQHARQWSWVKPPLRPGAEDLVWIQEVLSRWPPPPSPGPTALILGVTPELTTLNWPAGSQVVASDLSRAMIRGVWPTDRMPGIGKGAFQADWFALPLGDQSCDLVCGDCPLVVLRGAQAAPLVRSVRRVLKVGGTFVLRVFVRPEMDERPEGVWEHLMARRIGNFHVFKFRLLMSLRRDRGEVWVADAWDFFESRCPSVETLARHLGWPVEEVQTIQAYRGQAAIYWYPTVAEFRALATSGFEETACLWPTYEMGDRCPTFVLRRRG